MARNYYLVLGISSEASPEEIKQAYRRKVLELHPDRHGGDAGPFLEVQEAYSVLGDPRQRTAYDRQIAPTRYVMSRRAVREQQSRQQRPPVEPIGPVKTPIDRGEVFLTQAFETFAPSFDEIFERLWSNFTGTPRPKSETPESLTVDVPLSREDARVGGRIRVMVPAELECPVCDGSGGIGPYACWRCGGAGRITGEFPVVVSYPAGIVHGYTVSVPMTQLGIRNLYLTVRFYVT